MDGMISKGPYHLQSVIIKHVNTVVNTDQIIFCRVMTGLLTGITRCKFSVNNQLFTGN